MPATTRTASVPGTEVGIGDHNSIITANETNQLRTGSGKLAGIVVSDAGTAWVVDIYDDPGANNNLVYRFATAAGLAALQLQIPMQGGIRVVTSGTTPGRVCVIWS